MAKLGGYYAVRVGVKPGIYRSWSEAEPLVKGFPKAAFKKFNSEREAIEFLGDTTTRNAVATTSKAVTSDVSVQTLKVRTRDAEVQITTKKIKSRKKEEVVAREVYSDGSCLNNGKTNATAGIGVHWKGGESEDLAERLPGLLQTNNRAEMYAIARILEEDPTPHLPLVICTDSAYSIGAFSIWLPGWIRREWKTSNGGDVLNKDIILYVLALIKSRMRPGSISTSANITFRKVKAHDAIDGEEGNEIADKLAKLGASIIHAVPEINFEEATIRLEQKLECKGIKDIDQYDFMFDGSDFLTEEELKELEATQDF